MFSGKGVMKDIPLDLIIIPVTGQRLQTVETGKERRVIEPLQWCYGLINETEDELMMRLALSAVQEIIFCAVFVFVPVAENVMEQNLL